MFLSARVGYDTQMRTHVSTMLMILKVFFFSSQDGPVFSPFLSFSLSPDKQGLSGTHLTKAKWRKELGKEPCVSSPCLARPRNSARCSLGSRLWLTEKTKKPAEPNLRHNPSTLGKETEANAEREVCRESGGTGEVERTERHDSVCVCRLLNEVTSLVFMSWAFWRRGSAFCFLAIISWFSDAASPRSFQQSQVSSRPLVPLMQLYRHISCPIHHVSIEWDFPLPHFSSSPSVFLFFPVSWFDATLPLSIHTDTGARPGTLLSLAGRPSPRVG